MVFKDFNFDSNLITMLDNIKVITPTKHQVACFDAINKNKNILCTSKTNSGKTLTYLITAINNASKNNFKNISTVIIVPTKELCIHILSFAKKISRYTKVKCVAIYGGVKKTSQENSVKGANIIIATPGRLLDFLESKTICLKNINFLVLDEYDEFLNSNLKETLIKIKVYLKKPQILLFSASETVDVKDILENYELIKEEDETLAPSNIKNYYFITKNKEGLLIDHLKNENIFCALIFCNSKVQVEKVHNILKKNNISCDYIHSKLEHNIRTKVINNFKTGKLQALVTTNLLSRGISFKHLTHVINYDVAENNDIYIQRVGRSGRFKIEGTIFNYCYSNEESKLKQMTKILEISLESESL